MLSGWLVLSWLLGILFLPRRGRLALAQVVVLLNRLLVHSALFALRCGEWVGLSAPGTVRALLGAAVCAWWLLLRAEPPAAAAAGLVVLIIGLWFGSQERHRAGPSAACRAMASLALVPGCELFLLGWSRSDPQALLAGLGMVLPLLAAYGIWLGAGAGRLEERQRA